MSVGYHTITRALLILGAVFGLGGAIVLSVQITDRPVAIVAFVCVVIGIILATTAAFREGDALVDQERARRSR